MPARVEISEAAWKKTGVSPKDIRMAEQAVAYLDGVATRSIETRASHESDARLRELLGSLQVSDFLQDGNTASECVVLGPNQQALVEIGQMITRPEQLALFCSSLYYLLENKVDLLTSKFKSALLRSLLGQRIFDLYVVPLTTKRGFDSLITNFIVTETKNFNNLPSLVEKLTLKQ